MAKNIIAIISGKEDGNPARVHLTQKKNVNYQQKAETKARIQYHLKNQ